ncbi:MAG: zinc ribbon protein, partial [Solirubrobacterales bacterium]|nr:zinc ribbon protein [Solirubrobacterales bacterium]
DFIRCPSCLRKLKERCASCSRPLDQAWTICPYCEADVPGLSGSRSRRRRGAAPEIESDLDEFDVPTATADSAAARSRRRRGSAPEIESDLGELDVPAAPEEAAAEDAEPALATEPAPARPRRPTSPGGRSRPSS